MKLTRHDLFMIVNRQKISMPKRYRETSKDDFKKLIIDNSNNVEYRQFSTAFQSTLEKMFDILDNIIENNTSDHQYTDDNNLYEKLSDELIIRRILAENQKNIQKEKDMEILHQRHIIIKMRHDNDATFEDNDMNDAIEKYYLKTGLWLQVFIPDDE